MKVSLEHDDWRKIVYCGVENEQIDFKSAQDWTLLSRAGKAKFARHAMALANTMGGYVVVGVSEDASGKPNIYTGLTEKEAASFDPSTVGQTINRYADPAVVFDLVRPTIDGKTYVIFVVYPFRELPHVCVDACNDTAEGGDKKNGKKKNDELQECGLQRGAFYIRTPEARSRVACRASELQMIIRRSLRNQRESLGRMLRGILYENRLEGGEDSAGQFAEDELHDTRVTMREVLAWADTRKKPLFEWVARPQKRLREVSLTTIRGALNMLEQPAAKDYPWPDACHRCDCFATNDSLRGRQLDGQGKTLCHWEFFQSGLFYCAVPLPAAGDSGIAADDVLKLTFLSVAFVGKLFSAMNRPDELLTVTLRLNNVAGQRLVASQPEHQEENRCLIPDVEVRKERSAGDLEAGGDAATAAKMFLEICERFNVSFEKATEDGIQTRLEEYLQHALLL